MTDPEFGTDAWFLSEAPAWPCRECGFGQERARALVAETLKWAADRVMDWSGKEDSDILHRAATRLLTKADEVEGGTDEP